MITLFHNTVPLDNHLPVSQALHIIFNYLQIIRIKFFYIDLTNKVLRVVLKTKFDVEMILEKIDQLEHNLSSVYQTNYNKTDNIEENDFWEILPIKDENQLNEIENKLLNKTFRSSLVSIGVYKCVQSMYYYIYLVLLVGSY